MRVAPMAAVAAPVALAVVTGVITGASGRRSYMGGVNR